jgi:hypothetical protein
MGAYNIKGLIATQTDGFWNVMLRDGDAARILPFVSLTRFELAIKIASPLERNCLLTISEGFIVTERVAPQYWQRPSGADNDRRVFSDKRIFKPNQIQIGRDYQFHCHLAWTQCHG